MRRPAILAALLLAGGRPALAQRTLAIERFDAAIRVEADGTVDVSETITARFTGSWNGIYRSIPVSYRSRQGEAWSLHLDFQGATDAAGAALRWDRERTGDYLRFRVWVPGAQDATRTLTLHYRVRDGVRFFPEHDELYWNVTGDEWDVPIASATATIALPPGAEGVRATSFNGVYGATAQDAGVAIEGRSVRITMPRPLGFHEGLTAVVGWNKGAVAPPTTARQAVRFGANNWPLAIPVAVLGAMLLLWLRLGRDPERLPVAVQYEPPGDMTPAEAGTLIDDSADLRDITATLVDLAVRGHLTIEEREDKRFLGLFTSRDYVFHPLSPASGARGLAPHEQRVLEGIFGGGTAPVRLSDLEHEFYTHIPRIRNEIYGRLIKRGLYRARPDRVKGAWKVVGIALGIGIVAWGATLGAARYDVSPISVFAAAIASGLIVVWFSRIMPARTVAGARALERVRGFEEFLRRVEGERFKDVVLTPQLFEQLLPYAMVFRVERKWARAFEGIYREPPSWYVGSNLSAFDAAILTSRLSDLTTRAGTTMTSTPRSSSDSGFSSSGGFSGGGSGWGGGGGF